MRPLGPVATQDLDSDPGAIARIFTQENSTHASLAQFANQSKSTESIAAVQKANLEAMF